MLDFGLLVVASHLGGSSSLVEELAVYLDFEILVIGLPGNPADILRDQCAQAVHVAQHRAAFYLVGPDGGFIDGGSSRAEPCDAKGEARDGNDGDADIDNAADLFRVGVGWSLNVHG